MNYWIGKNNIFGRLRYWYYGKRGWVINNEHFYIGKRADEVIKDILRDFKARGGRLK